MALVQNEKSATKLLKRFVTANEWQKNQILEDAEQLHRPPVIDEFFFSKKPTKKRKGLFFYKGKARAFETVLNGARFEKKAVDLPMTKVVDAEKRFEFILECGDDTAFIVCCKVAPKMRGKGLFKQMVEAIRDVCFNDLGKRIVLGSARPPRDEQESDWRDEKIFYRENLNTGEDIKLTKLHKLWLDQKLVVHSSVIGDKDPHGFAILNPDHLAGLSVEDLEDLDKRHPKEEIDSFVSFMGAKGAAV